MEKGLNKKNVAEKFSFPQNALTYWYNSGQFGAKRQKLSVVKHDSVDKAVYKWFMNEHKQNVPIGGHIIRGKVLDFAK